MSLKTKILLVDDDPDVEVFVRAYLTLFEVEYAASISEAKRKLESKFSLILLDLNLPDGDGLSFCRELKMSKSPLSVPVIMITAKSQKSDVVEGLYSGADDYISKPIHGPELKARVENCLKRSLLTLQSKVSMCGFEFDLELQKCRIIASENDDEMDLTPTEFKILLSLVKANSRLISRDEMSQRIWKESGVHVNGRAIDSHIAHLRKKLGKLGLKISSVYGSGYCFNTEEANVN